MLHSFHIALFPYHTVFIFAISFTFNVFSVLHFFHVSLFSCSLSLWYIHFVLHFFRVALFSCFAVSMWHFFRVALFSYCTFFKLRSVFMLDSFHVAFFLSRIFSCYSFSLMHYFHTSFFVLHSFILPFLRVTLFSCHNAVREFFYERFSVEYFGVIASFSGAL